MRLGATKEEGARAGRLPRNARSVRQGEERLAACVLDLACPSLLNRADDLGGHRYIIELFSHLAALVVGPVEELEGGGGGRRILRLLVDQDPGCSRHRP